RYEAIGSDMRVEFYTECSYLISKYHVALEEDKDKNILIDEIVYHTVSGFMDRAIKVVNLGLKTYSFKYESVQEYIDKYEKNRELVRREYLVEDDSYSGIKESQNDLMITINNIESNYCDKNYGKQVSFLLYQKNKFDYKNVLACLIQNDIYSAPRLRMPNYADDNST